MQTWKNLSDVVDNEAAKNTKFNTLKTKVNNSEKKVPDATTLIHINQYNTVKQNLEKKIGGVDNKIPDKDSSITTTILNTKISEVENKTPNTSSLVTTTVHNTQNLVKLRTKFLIRVNILRLLYLIS